MAEPIFTTTDLASFRESMGLIANELIGVATNYTTTEERTCLSAKFQADPQHKTNDGWLIAVRDDTGLPLEILLMARDLHQKIQAFYQAQEVDGEN